MEIKRRIEEERREGAQKKSRAPVREPAILDVFDPVLPGSVDADDLAILLPLEGHVSVDQREERVVAADPDVVAGMEFRAPLTHQDVSGADSLTTKPLDAKVLRIRIAAVAR